MASKQRVAIQETHTLPSHGRLYPEGSVPEQVTLRAMSTMDEKIRLSSTSGIEVVPLLINSCTVEPQNFDASMLKLFDLQFLMYKLRTITYGPNYDVELICPYCGERFKVTVNLDNLKVNEVPENLTEPFEIGPLPVSGDVLGCRIQNSEDLKNIRREAKRIKSKFPDYVGDPEFILDIQYCLSSKNGTDFKPYETQSYVENMHARDLQFFRSKYSQIVDNLGLDLNLVDICPACEKDVEYSLPVTEEFFRPRY